MPQSLRDPARSHLPTQALPSLVVTSRRWYCWLSRNAAALLLLSGVGTLALTLPARCESAGVSRSRPIAVSTSFRSTPFTAAGISAQRPTAPASSRSAPPPAAPSVAWLIVMPSVPILGGTWIYFTRRLFGTGKVMNTERRSLEARPEPSPYEPPMVQDDNADTDS
ncbi:MAG: hypothetical protein AAF773_07255 [Cyanobacteria bacterium P01_D01_bin.115]